MRDVAGNDVYVSVGSGTVIYDNSAIWDGGGLHGMETKTVYMLMDMTTLPL